MTGFVIVRVHDRMADLEVLVDLIARAWTAHAYEVLVVSNGASRGVAVPESVRRSGAGVVELADNPGHLGGSARLLAEGVRRIPAAADFVVLIEADTWLLSDRLVDRYARRLVAEGAVWASAEWLERWHSVAVDFAVVDAAYLRGHPGLVAVARHPETHVATALRRDGARYLHIRELMPVHVPSALRRFGGGHGGRYRAFPEGPMVTHHLEDLPGGLAEKMALANGAAGRRVFDVAMPAGPETLRRRMLTERRLARLAPRSGWFRRPKDRPA